MNFFEYNEQIVNLEHVTNFSCPQTEDKKGYTLTSHMDYAKGYWKEDLMPVGAIVELGVFQSKKEALQVARDIIAGNYAVNTIQTPTESEPVPEPENKTEVEETPTDDPEELNKIIEGTRELYRNPFTDTICGELGINKTKIYGEAQRLWGSSDNWTMETWQNYLHAIAHFHQRKGILYDSFQPNTDKPKNGNQKKENPF